MNNFNATIIADSVSKLGHRITTLQLSYPRFIHSELMTHRAFSRNAMSSRAIPVAKMLKQVWREPAMPVHWGKNQAGMQAHTQLTGYKLKLTKFAWRTAAKLAASVAWLMTKTDTHKQVANRLLEPFQWMQTIVTSTEWSNFYDLRIHEDAQPEFRVLAIMIQNARAASVPKLLYTGMWHLPYVNEKLSILTACQVSAARCARVSYLTHDGAKPSIAADLKLFERLAGGRPLHASPLEHQATPGKYKTGNFVGWTQHRKLWEESL